MKGHNLLKIALLAINVLPARITSNNVKRRKRFLSLLQRDGEYEKEGSIIIANLFLESLQQRLKKNGFLYFVPHWV